MGTYVCRFQLSSTTMAAGVVGDLPYHWEVATAGSFTSVYDMGLTPFHLDGGAAIAFDSLPAGFRVLSAALESYGYSLGTYIGAVERGDTGNTAQGNVDFGTYPSVDTFAASAGFQYSLGLPALSSPIPSALDIDSGILTLTFTLIKNVTPDASLTGLSRDNLQISGTYDILSSGITLSPDPVMNDDEVTVDADDNLDDITNIKAYDEDGNLLETISVFNSQSPTQIKFNLNTGTFDGPVVLFGTTTSGSVLLGILTVLIANGSGLYVITAGKTNDTLYVDSHVSPTTEDVAIPDPFFKTGFIGG